METIPGQGDCAAPPWFNFHWITKVNGFLYDPSYGTEKVSVDDGVAYENRAFDGYVSRGVIPFIRKTGEDCDVWFKEF